MLAFLPLLHGYPYGLFRFTFEPLIPSALRIPRFPRSKTTIPVLLTRRSTTSLSPVSLRIPDCIFTKLVWYTTSKEKKQKTPHNAVSIYSYPPVTLCLKLHSPSTVSLSFRLEYWSLPSPNFVTPPLVYLLVSHPLYTHTHSAPVVTSGYM